MFHYPLPQGTAFSPLSQVIKCAVNHVADNKYVSIIKTIIALNKNELDLIPNDIINDIQKRLQSWIRIEIEILDFVRLDINFEH